MFSPLKVALFAIVSLTTLTFAFAIPSPRAPQPGNPMTLISNTNARLQKTLQPLCMRCLPTPHATHANRLYADFVTPANATSDCLIPIVDQAVEIIGDLVSTLERSSLSGCDCTSYDILILTATTLKVLVIPLSSIFLLRSYSPYDRSSSNPLALHSVQMGA
jgi:hypothetical protein